MLKMVLAKALPAHSPRQYGKSSKSPELLRLKIWAAPIISLFEPLPSDKRASFSHSSSCSLVPASRIGAMEMERLAYSINDTGKALSVGRTTVYSMIADGRLETFKLGTRTLIKAESIRRLIAGEV
jgi:excisionase family DNA binding protein